MSLPIHQASPVGEMVRRRQGSIAVPEHYGDAATYAEAAARGRSTVLHMKPVPIFAVTCTAATMEVA